MHIHRNDTRKAAQDVSKAISQRSVWMALGWNDVRSRYNRSKLGALWAGLSLMILVSALGPVYSSLMSVELSEYLMHLLLGFIIWNYVSAIISDSGREFVNSEGYLTSFQLSYFTLLMRVIWRNFVVLCYQFLVFVVFVILFQQPVTTEWIIIPVALFIITLNALWMGLLMSIFATRYRDFDELMNNLLRLVFFVTPIMWMPTFKSDLLFIADINPFYHLIEIFREPLTTGALGSRSWIIAGSMAVIGWLIAFPIYARYRSRIAFWL